MNISTTAATGLSRRFVAGLIWLSTLMFCSIPLFSQTQSANGGPAQPSAPTASQSKTRTQGPASERLTVDHAVKEALNHSSDVQSAIAAWKSARDKALQAKLNLLPSVSLSGSYTRLSQLPSSDTSLTLPLPPPPTGPGPIHISISTPLDAFSFGVNLSYPIFTGFRLMEAAKIAELQSTNKETAIRIVRNALTFEVQRAYWESLRATSNVKTMEKNLSLVRVLRAQVKEEVDQGLATQADLLSADERYNQAQIGLNDVLAARTQAFLMLSSLLGQDATGASLASSGEGGFQLSKTAAYNLSTNPAVIPYPQLTGELDAAKLVSEALADRPEMQTASIGVETATRAAKAAQGNFYPTVSVIGGYTYADPNQRVLFSPSSQFTGTWDVGVAVNIDVGKLPSDAAGSQAAGNDLENARAQAEAERTKIVLDVRKSILSYEMAKQDLGLTKGTVPEAEENLRVTRQKFEQGLAKRSDVLRAELAVLRAQFGVMNREVSLQIAAADLARAVGIRSE